MLSICMRQGMVSIIISIMLLIFAGISSIIILNMAGNIRSLIESDDAVYRFEKEYARVALLSALKASEPAGIPSFVNSSLSFSATQTVLAQSKPNIQVQVQVLLEQEQDPIVISFKSVTSHHQPVEAMIFK